MTVIFTVVRHCYRSHSPSRRTCIGHHQTPSAASVRHRN